MTSSFNVRNAAGYEQLMGRWSKRLAPLFINFAGISDGERILDVGCGTGSLTFALPQFANIAEIAAIDYSPIFVEAVAAGNADPRINIRQADACSLPFDDDGFDRAMALLVLHFVPDADKAVAEMCRVVRPGGVVAAAVWDHPGGMPAFRMAVDILATFGAGGRLLRDHYCSQPMTRPGDLQQVFDGNGLVDVKATELKIRMEFRNFDDYWGPVAGGEGPIGRFVADLGDAERRAAAMAVREAYEAGGGDGPRSFVAVAWAVRGVLPGLN
jgi:SAM-dependent methyltransferase